MADLADKMPNVQIDQTEMALWGQRWLGTVNEETSKGKKSNAFDRQQSVNFASFIDRAFANALAEMLGNIPVCSANSNALLPPEEDCVEVGPVRIIGGIRPQNFDAAYRPDGPRVLFDSKSLNDRKSVGKNWQNMVNDLASEAATAHTRFPYAIVTFVVIIPRPALPTKQENDLVRTLERLGARSGVLDQDHLAEAIALLVWEPSTGEIVSEVPNPASPLRIEKFASTLYPHYVARYKGLPPHD
ncbi:MAG: hypothetical protein KF753_13280 [Caldilineaceae bacterium]|nr:hypothetical protein [Caldilineaceae bacterium]